MKKVFVSVIDSLHYLLAGEQDEETEFKQKLLIVLGWFVAIAFCLLLLKLFLG